MIIGIYRRILLKAISYTLIAGKEGVPILVYLTLEYKATWVITNQAARPWAVTRSGVGKLMMYAYTHRC